MENLYNELWLKDSSSNLIQEFSVQVPVPLFLRQPGYKFQLQRASVDHFPLTGITPQVKQQTFKLLQTGSGLPWDPSRFLVRDEYLRIERLLEHVASRKWTKTDPETGRPLQEQKLDYKVSGQPGSGV
jgi:hypothetical protein